MSSFGAASPRPMVHHIPVNGHRSSKRNMLFLVMSNGLFQQKISKKQKRCMTVLSILNIFDAPLSSWAFHMMTALHWPIRIAE